MLVSTIGADRDAQAAWVPAQRPEQLRAATESNLRSLHVEQVDVMNLRLHGPSGDGDTDQDVDLDSQLAEMVALREEGKIGAIG